MYIDSSSYSLLSSQSEFIFYAATNSFIDAVTHNVTIFIPNPLPCPAEDSAFIRQRAHVFSLLCPEEDSAVIRQQALYSAQQRIPPSSDNQPAEPLLDVTLSHHDITFKVGIPYRSSLADGVPVEGRQPTL